MSNATNAKGVEGRINPKYHFPTNIGLLERHIRLSLGLPFYGKMGGEVAYGYEYIAAENKYEPQDELIHLLWQARKFLYASSLREVATWLNFKAKKLGYKSELTFEGLRKIMFNRPPYEECLLPREQKEEIVKSVTQWNQRTLTDSLPLKA